MPPRRRSRSHPEAGLRSILDDLRTRILSGSLPAGGRLPAVRELATVYGVAANTIQRSLQELAGAGFIVAEGRNCTRVVDFPPHRHCYGLVLPTLPAADGSYTVGHWQAKAVAAQAVGATPSRRIEVFHGISGHPELPEHRRLLAALAEHRLAGLILPDEQRIRDWLTPRSLELPVVGVDPQPSRPAIGQLRLDLVQFLEQALATVADHGRRRPAVLLNHQGIYCLPGLAQAARQAGLALPPQRIQSLSIEAPSWAAHVLAGLFAVDPGAAPDALIVTDEAVIPAVESALVDLGRGDLLQVQLTNLPLPPVGRLPALRLGWDHRDYLVRAMELIDGWHQRREPIGDRTLLLTAVISGP